MRRIMNRFRQWLRARNNTIRKQPPPSLEILEGREMPSGNPIPVFGTGLSSSGQLLSGGTADSHYSIVSAPSPDTAGQAMTTTESGITTWVAEGPNSEWISPHTNEGTTSGEPAGSYTYQTTFNLTGFNPSTTVLTGEFAAAYSLGMIMLNGENTGIVSDGQSDSATFRSFSISSGFVGGVNTLDFVIGNQTQGAPSGLHVDLTGTAQDLTTTTLAASATAVDQGQNVTLTATVASSVGAPGGTVTFSRNGSTLGSAILNSSGVATFTTNSLSLGRDPITAAYSGSSAFSASQSAATAVTVYGPPQANNDSYSGLHDRTLQVAASAGVLSNDSSPIGATLSAVLNGGPSHGTLTFNSNGSFAYTPNAGYVGADAFTYYDTDGSLNSNTATVSLSVTDQAPVANPASYTLTQDQTLQVASGGVLANDSDPDGDPLSASIVTGPVHGSLTLNGNGTFTYTPTTGFIGTDTFVYAASDGALSSDATATLTVQALSPTAQNDSYSLIHDHTLTVSAASGVLSNDSAPDNEALTAALVAGPSHGTLTFQADGSFVYTPNTHYVGQDSFTYQAIAAGTSSSPAIVTLNVTNQAPVTGAISYSLLHDRTDSVSAAQGVLTAANDADGDALTATLVTGTSNGTLVLNSDGSFAYTPQAGYLGQDNFQYKVSDGITYSNTATVSISVIGHAPVACPVSYALTQDQTLQVTSGGVLANDSDPDGYSLTASVVTGPTHGSLTLNSNGTFTYTPTTGFIGTDTFVYAASNGALSSNATVTLTVQPLPPTTQNSSYSVVHDRTLSVSAVNGVLSTDSAPDNETLTAALVAGPSDGTLTLQSDGAFVYKPSTHYVGQDSFTYQAIAAGQPSSPTTVTLTVTNEAPTANAISYTLLHDRTDSVSASQGVLTAASDADGDALTVTLVSGPSNGTLVLNSDGSFGYTPQAGYLGQDSFQYEVSDGITYSNTATVSISVIGHAPVANPVSYKLTQDQTLQVTSGGVLANDSDPDGYSLTASVVTGPTHGSLTLNANGTFTYTPTTGFIGTDTFVYAASNGALSSTATATLTVQALPPTAQNASYSLIHDRTLTVSVANGVLSNDSAPDNETLTAALVAGPSYGTLIFQSDGSFVYTPSTHYVGQDSFTYQAIAAGAVSSPAIVTLNVTDQAPVASALSYSLLHDRPYSVGAAQGVLSGATDADNDPLTALVLTGPSNGTLVLNSDGSFTYTPNAGYVGQDSFQYAVSDGITTSNTATVSLAVIDHSPVANPGAYTLTQDQTLQVSSGGVLADDSDPDGDSVTASLVTGPAHGSLTLNPDGTFTYTPTTGFIGIDSFIYAASDGILTSNATVTLTIQALPPTAQDDQYSLVHDSILSVSADGVLSNDSAPDGELLNATLLSGPGNGTLVLQPDGSFIYSPNTAFIGQDSFTYAAVAAGQLSAPATVTLTVTDQAPVVPPLSYAALQDQPLNVSANQGILRTREIPITVK